MTLDLYNKNHRDLDSIERYNIADFGEFVSKFNPKYNFVGKNE